MAAKSVFLPDPLIRDNSVEVAGEEHHHLIVTRAEAGEPVEIFDGRGKVWSGAIVASGKKATTVRIESVRTIPVPSGQLILGLAMIRSAAFELAVEKCVEIGVTRIVPFVAARSNNTADRQDRWRRIVIEAAKQSKRYHLPAVDAPLSFEQLLELPAT